jgi:uncharacterized protein (DUF1697 family)
VTVALVVLLRGVNVGGHRTFRPSVLAAQLQHLDAVNIGAAGTFVVRRPASQARVRAEFARRLPFETRIVICDGRDIIRVMSVDHFTRERAGPAVVRFLSVLPQSPRSAPVTPVRFPPRGQWLVKVVARQGRFVIGMYRRNMKTIGYLGGLDKAFGAPVTTRNWNTLTAIAAVLTRAPE